MFFQFLPLISGHHCPCTSSGPFRPTFPEIVIITTEVTILWLKSYMLILPRNVTHHGNFTFFRPISIPLRQNYLFTAETFSVNRHFQNKSSQNGARVGEAGEEGVHLASRVICSWGDRKGFGRWEGKKLVKLQKMFH